MVQELKITANIQPPLPPPPDSPNPSMSSKSNCDDEEKWRLLMENHHELCDLGKCLGKRINGLFVCQFSNIPGHLYSQYLRHRRRQSAYKTKPCRNYYGPNHFCPSGDQCSFFHEMDEKRDLFQPSVTTNLVVNCEGGVDPSVHSFAFFESTDATLVYCDNDVQHQQHQQTLNSLIVLVTETYQRMCNSSLIHQSHQSGAEFDRSFHPFSESYPLKNLFNNAK